MGEGGRKQEWVLEHGGTIIKYEIGNISGDSNEYKAVMYDDEGDYVEKEFGTKAKFDDAKNDKYKIKAYRVEGGIIDRTTHKGGKEFASIKVTAHPGETIKIKFDYKKKKAKMTTDYIEPIPKPVIKPALIITSEPEIEIQQKPESSESQNNQVTTTMDNNESLIEVAEDFIHPDAMAMEVEQPSVVKSEKPANIFERLLIFIKNLFG